MSKLPLRKEPEIHFVSMPPGRWESAAELAAIFHEEYDSYPGTDCAYLRNGGAYYIRATPGGNVTVWWQG